MKKYITKSFYCSKETYETLKSLSSKYGISDSGVIKIAVELINDKQYILENFKKPSPFNN